MHILVWLLVGLIAGFLAGKAPAFGPESRAQIVKGLPQAPPGMGLI